MGEEDGDAYKSEQRTEDGEDAFRPRRLPQAHRRFDLVEREHRTSKRSYDRCQLVGKLLEPGLRLHEDEDGPMEEVERIRELSDVHERL